MFNGKLFNHLLAAVRNHIVHRQKRRRMMIKIPLTFQVWLGSQPEYAMGYQYGTVELSTGSYQTGYILNGACFATRDELTTLSPPDLAKAEVAASMSKFAIVNISLIPRSAESLKNVRRIRTASSNLHKLATFSAMNESARASQGAKDAPITATVAGEIFKRFSAYENDFRITDKRALKKGTFATTAADAIHVRTGREAVSRYALENKQSANKCFTITPLADTRLQSGIVQPAYGELGGGVEVIFVDGTTDWTVSQPEYIPE